MRQLRVAAGWFFVVLFVLSFSIPGQAAVGRDRKVVKKHAKRAVPAVVIPVTTAVIRHPIARGDSLLSILCRYGVSTTEAHRWEKAARPRADLGKLKAGRFLSLELGGEQVLSIRYRVNDEKDLLVEKANEKKFSARFEELPVRIRIVGAQGFVKGNFRQSARRAGLPDPIVSTMADVLGWNINFDRDTQPGDRFRVLYEQRTTVEGKLLRPGRLMAVDYTGTTVSAAAFLYEDETGEIHYVDAEGAAAEQTFLRYPLEFSRMSSEFSGGRFHPILKRSRPHLGVDFAAPTGTPVRAISSGTVRFAGRKCDFGNHVEIDHGGATVSAYSHLRGVDSAIAEGKHVKQGQLLGWVGQSGLATGPHLHFAIFENGKYVNPLEIKRPIGQKHVDTFHFAIVRDSYLAQLRTLPSDYGGAASSSPILLSGAAQSRHLGPVALTI